MSGVPSLHGIASVIGRRVRGLSGLSADDLSPLPDRGLSHQHILVPDRRIDGHPVLLRVPRLSQFALAPEDHLRYQSAAFERTATSGVTPRLLDVALPEPDLPLGALVVEAVKGRAARIPDDLAPMAKAMASVHALPVALPENRAPLRDHPNPVRSLMDTIVTQAAFLDQADIDADSAAAIEAELAWARRFTADQSASEQPVCLTLTDTHSGNFVMRDGPPPSACFVDLEKALYGSPAVDLAHATLATSLHWDIAVTGDAGPPDVEAFYRAWLDAVPPALGQAALPWFMPLRRLTWLRTTTWSIRWSVETAGGGLWTMDGLDPTLTEHVRRRLQDFVSPETVARCRADWDGPQRLSLD